MPDKLFGWTKEKVLENKISSLERQLKEAKQNNQDLIHLIENLTRRIHDLDQAYFNKSQDYIDSQCLTQSLNRDLKTAQQVAQYWKLESQANEILTDIYKERGGEFHDSI